jgi:hypothetical protein
VEAVPVGSGRLKQVDVDQALQRIRDIVVGLAEQRRRGLQADGLALPEAKQPERAGRVEATPGSGQL